ncbi:ubiquitin-related domain-containing protein [Colletotrichum navitas]|uniref:Ubiquitin-related domain-containing protein n=1 Tax=Colletotrichum navitas TaxID=681940 RepID=A0AAD8Q8W1_9PEZI|nr:ubiquitin-related domain-containing protein [Colletotrichum navitas]KAK1598171.1 ubiquitin-related domain-containing protein [Colletotrichum navitas]
MADANPADVNMSSAQPVKGSLAESKDAVPMKTLPQSSLTDADTIAASNTAKTTATTTSSNHGASSNTATDSATAVPATSDASDSIEPSAKGKEKQSAPPQVDKNQDDAMAIGPSVDDVQSVSNAPSDGPVCNITLLLTTGARHPYKLDEKYLTKRNVNVPGLTEAGKKDPFTISVYTLKELILREWREEWDPKPASPSSIRLIHFGKLLDDKDQLKQYHFSAEAANVVHMTVRPADIVEEEEPKGGNKSASGGGRSREGGSGCCVIL